MELDIIIPVWNRPVETRACLVSLIEHTPGRLILVDNGSDRETENLLEEFAEVLDERALLLRTESNRGFVRAANLGLSRADAPLVAVVRNSSLFPAGWLDPLLRLAGERRDVGILLPALAKTDSPRTGGSPVTTEVPTGAFGAMIIRRDMLRQTGPFDEAMDSGEWCLKDFSRRCHAAGYRTVRVPTPPVLYREEPQLGSVVRRQETELRSREEYERRWGKEMTVVVSYGADAAIPLLLDHLPLLEEGARRGHRFRLLLHRRLHREMVRAQLVPAHEEICCMPLPMFFVESALQRQWDLLTRDASCMAVSAGGAFPQGVQAVPFEALEETVLRPFDHLYRPREARQ